MQKMEKMKFYEGLISTSDYVEYEKKEIEWYDPVKEIEEKLYGDYVSEDYQEDFKDEDYQEGFDSYSVTSIRFKNKRISQKYEQLVFRYRKIIDRETIFGFCLDIISQYIYEIKKDYIHIATKKTIKNNKLGYHDDITTINVMLDTRINRKIDEWRGTKKEQEKGTITYYAPPFLESMETELKPNKGDNQDPDNPKTIGDMASLETNIFHSELADYTYQEIDQRLHKIYKKSKLTDREIEVLEALERTPNNDKGNTYTRALAGQQLSCTGQNISNIFNRAKKKIKKAYKKETRLDLLLEIDDFLNNIEDEKDIIDFIMDRVNDEMINYILYESDLDYNLVKYFNKNHKAELKYHSDLMRKFCTYFLKELYTYKDLIESNINIHKAPKKTPVRVEKWQNKNIDKNIYTYIIESKLEEHEKKGKFIIVDDEKYYYIKSSKQEKKKERVNKYETMTFLKR